MIKCELIVSGYSYRVTDDVRNWDDMVVSMKRADYDGVVRSFTSKFEFVNAAHLILKNQYRENYLEAAASVVISGRNNSWGWNEVFRCTLDFSTYNDDGMAISINAVDDSLAGLIKAKRGTQYEYSVDVIKEEKQLLYDRLEMMSTFSFTFSDTFTVNAIEDNVKLHVSSFNNEVSEGNYIEPDINEIGTVANITDVPDSGIDITLDADVEYENKGEGAYVTVTLSSLGKTKDIKINKGESKNILFNIHITKSDFDSFQQQKRIYMSIILKSATGGLTYAVFNIRKINRFTASYTSRREAVNLDVVSPVKLLNRLIQSMNGGKEGLTGVIDYNGHPNLWKCVILAAESARGLKSAKLYSSYSKFCEWMSAVFGFVPVVGDNMVAFVHRDSLFKKKVVKIIDSISDFEYSTDSSMIYSRIRVGYEKQDYDSINGRDEFRFTNEYTSGVNLTDNTLELISPYRADAYGIEFLVQKRGEDTTDNSSDNNVFFVNAIESDQDYRLARDISISGVISPETMFNAVYAPSFMINTNKKFIGTSISRLTFASGDGNSDVVIDGVAESSDITINSRLFTVGTVSIETADLAVQDDLSGLVSFEKNKEVYRGYIKSVGSNYGRDEAVKYVLIIESVSPVGVIKKVCTITREISFISPIMYEKIVSDNPVSSDVIVKKYIVNEETGFAGEGSMNFIIPKGEMESIPAPTFIAKPGYRTEYSLDADEDNECIYVLSI